jgi:hypothetical protein
LHHAHGPGAGRIELKDLAEPGPEDWNGSVVALPLGLIDLTEKIAPENGLKKESVAAEGITDELFSGSLNRGLNFSLGGGKYGGRKAGQQGLLFHINKPYAGQLFVSFFGAFSTKYPLSLWHSWQTVQNWNKSTGQNWAGMIDQQDGLETGI